MRSLVERKHPHTLQRSHLHAAINKRGLSSIRLWYSELLQIRSGLNMQIS